MVSVRLRPFTIADEPAARSAQAEMATEDFPFLLGWSEGEPWTAYLNRCEANRHGRELPDRWVPCEVDEFLRFCDDGPGCACSGDGDCAATAHLHKAFVA
jgi:hypothetical protein